MYKNISSRLKTNKLIILIYQSKTGYKMPQFTVPKTHEVIKKKLDTRAS